MAWFLFLLWPYIHVIEPTYGMRIRCFCLLGSGGMYASQGIISLDGEISFKENSAKDRGGTCPETFSESTLLDAFVQS